MSTNHWLKTIGNITSMDMILNFSEQVVKIVDECVEEDSLADSKCDLFKQKSYMHILNQ